ncbi:Type II secretion system protein E [Ferriphaselus amnicola]|jgi:MSHA biogenesis protein MshE|uniref:Type II secretion system protein E n=1 Tax=Ferriphaselus amnicola TaxID=1188319 RepID=A0A2Z6G955_9PROT|nr:GspE/PulE family protein [Ferriphaselus amnicola]BBE49997.1 Type II secretion system protein E [Ferriphaselus amnicola]
MARYGKARLGDMLVQLGHLLQDNLGQALEQQRQSGERLGKVLVERKFATEVQVAQALSAQLSLPFIDLRHFHLRPEISRRLSEYQSRRLHAIVLEEHDGGLLVGMVDPTDLLLYDELKRLLRSELTLAVVAESQFIETLDRVYRRTEEISGLAQELSDDMGEAIVDLHEMDEAASLEAAPVVKLLQTIFDDAMRIRASDVHIEPMERQLRIRFRIDGALHLQTEADPNIAPALVLRLKLMSGLDISEKRLPQDGRFHMRARDQVVDVRVSSMPTQYGESVVLRLLNRSGNFLSLEKLGMPPEMLKEFRKIIHRSEGMVLVTGPTGSGKTTTLYAALDEINSIEQKIVTVEDPVEYRLPGINQVQVNEKIDLTFARVLRSVLRQDPDIILVGEMRDPETAQIGLRAAITGHLVFSTLHTRDAAGTLARLVDMDVPRYMVASSVQVLLAQRLLRRVCESCSQPHTPSAIEAEWLLQAGVAEVEWSQLRTGNGCSYCNKTGYNGRQAIYEMLVMNRELIDLAAHHDSTRFIQAARQQLVGRTLLDDAISRMKSGGTSVAEVMRISNQVDD